MNARQSVTRYDRVMQVDLRGAVPIGDESRKKERHRELVLPARKAGRQTAFLKFVDTRFGWYNIPLGRIETRKRNGEPRTDTVLVPVVPVVYTTPDLDPKEADKPRPGGWVYIFRGSHLWRELEVLPYGMYRDVNLREYQGCDERPATVEQDSRILIPQKVGGEELDVWMAYSEVQWSWAYINALGGMSREDFRWNEASPPLMPEDMGVSAEQARARREARMQLVDLSGYEEGFPVQVPQGRRARRECSDGCTARTRHLKLHHKSRVPVVYLHDPLGVALNNVEAWWAVWSELKHLVEHVSGKAHSKSAALAWQAFFNAKLWEKKRRAARRGGRSDPYVDTSDGANTLRKAAMVLDEAKLRDVLEVEKRKVLRERLRKVKEIHVEWLEGKHAGRPVRETHPDFVDFNTAVLDYAWLPAPSYVRLWSVMSGVTGFLAHDPSALDGALDLPRERGHKPPGEDPGRRYLASLLDPAHPLHGALFPSREQVDEADADWVADPDRPEAPGAGPEFRPNAFAASLAPSLLGYGLQRYADDAVKLGEQIVSDFILVLGRQKEVLAKAGRTVELNALLRLAKAAHHADLQGLRLVNVGGVVRPGEVVLGMRISLVEGRVSLREARGSVVRGGLKEAVALKDAGGTVVGYVSPEQVPRFRGLRPALTVEEFQSLFVRAEGEVHRARVELIVARGEASPLLREYYLPGSTDSGAARAGARALHVAGKVLPPLVAVMEVLNLGKAVAKAREKGTTYEKVQVLIGIAALLQATAQAAVAIGGKDRVANALGRGLGRVGGVVDKALGKSGGYYKDLLGEAGRKAISGKRIIRLAGKPYEVTNLTVAGALLAGAWAVMAVWDAVNFALVDDDDAAAWSVAHAVALTGLGVALVVQSGATVLGMGPAAWAFFALAIVIAIIVHLVTDTPLEKWAKHGPFPKEGAPLREEYAGATEEEVYAHLLGLLQPVSLRVLEDPGVEPAGVVVEVVVPGFVPGDDVLDVRLTVEEWVDSPYLERTWHREERRLEPYAVKRWEDGETGALVGYRYYYRLDELPSGLPVNWRAVRVRACARRETAEGLNVPPPAVGREVAQVAERIPEALEGWAVAQPLKVRV